MKLVSLWLVILITSTAATTYSPATSITSNYAFDSTTTSNFALLIMAQSTFQDNVFKFTSQDVDFSNFLAAVEMKPITLTISLVFANTWTQQDADAISQDTTNCVTQTSYDCDVNPLAYDICSAIIPVPSQDSLVQVSSQSIDCTAVGATDSVCDLVLSNYDLSDTSSNVFFSTIDTLCPSSSITFVITIPALKLDTPIMGNVVGAGSVSFHFMSIRSGPQDEWMTSVSTWRLDTTSKIISTTPSEAYFDDSYLARSDIQTVIQTKVSQHDSSVDIYCQYQVTYTGLIRGIYINDYPTTNHMPREYDLDTQSTVQSTTSFLLRANQLNLITIVGYRLTNTILEFNNCYTGWDSGTAVTPPPNFSEFIFSSTSTSLPSQTYTIPSNRNYCPSSYCKQCTYSGVCIQCEAGYFLAYGGCSGICTGPLFVPDYKRVCSTILESTTMLIGSPQINSNDIVINYFDDFASANKQALVLHSKNEIYLNSAPTVWPAQLSLLPESVLIFLPTSSSLGTHQVTIPFTSVADSSVLAAYSAPSGNTPDYPADSFTSLSNKVFAIYYPLNPNVNNFIGVFWDTTTAPASLTQAGQKQTLSSTFLLLNRRYQYLRTNGFYIIQAFVSCVSECQIAAGSDGVVQLYKNDQLLVFNLNFHSRWTYQYSQPFTGSFHLKFIVRGANYFQPYVIGDDFQLYAPLNPTSIHPIGPLPVDQHTCSISNCLTCQDSICLSCKSGYYLSLDQSACLGSCPAPYYFSNSEASCQNSCDSSSQIFIPANNECLPTCDEPGYFYTSAQGCKNCIPECKTCSDANTCLECRIASPFNTPTYCFRKSGTLYDLHDFTTTQTASVLQESAFDLALIIADQSSLNNFTLFFTNPVRKIPRILKTIKMITDGSNTAHATIPPLDISESGSVTAHYIKIQQDNAPTNFSTTAFFSVYFNDWPLAQTFPQIDALVGPIVYNVTINDNEGLSQVSYGYYTITASKIYEHSETSQITCKLQISYSGDLRGVYVNGMMVFAGSNSGTSSTIKSRPFTLEPQEMFLVTYVGYLVDFQNIIFTDCTKPDLTSVTPQFNSYVLTGEGAESDDLYATSNTFCGQYCNNCLNEFTCLSCQLNYYLENGDCVPKCNDPTHLQLIYGFCQTQERTQGYRYYWNYYPSELKFSLWLYIVLEMDVQTLFILHPFSVTSTSHATYAFVPGNTPTMANGCYEIRNYAKTDGLQRYYPIVQSNVASSTGSVDILVYTVRNNLILFYYYNSQPSTLAQLLQAQYFDYIPLDGQVANLLNTNTYFWDFFVNCPSSCQLKLQGTGNIQVTQNERTNVFDAYLTEDLGEITLSRTFSGLNHFVIKVWNAEKFGFNIQGSGFTVLTQGHLVTHTSISIISAEPFLATNCINGYKSQCFSCQTGYFLDAATAVCTTSCPIGTQGLLTERLCANMTCDPANHLIQRDSSCVFNCTNAPGYYYTPESGCDNQCDVTCGTCSGPEETHCLSCTFPLLLQGDGTCICPAGTQDGVTPGTCDSLSTVSITFTTSPIYCSKITLTANIRADEQAAYTFDFHWSLVSSTAGNTDAKIQLEAYLANQSDRIIDIPGIYLDNDSDYTFDVYYMNAMNQKIENSYTVTVSYSTLSGISFASGNSQSISNYLQSTFLAEFDDNTACSFDISTIIDATWTIVSGSLTSVDLISSPNTPLQMTIPSCTLAPYDSAVLNLRISLKSDPTTYVEQILTLQTLAEKFKMFVKTNTRNHPETSNLILDGIIIYYEKCSIRAPQLPTYTWLCENITPPEGPCADPNGLFNSPSTISKVVVPRTYFQKGDEFTFTLRIEKNGVAQDTSIAISIQDSTTLVVQITCQTLDCLWYHPAKEFLLFGNIQTPVNGLPVTLSPAELDLLSMTWSIENAVIPFAYFETTFKMFATDYLQLPNNLDFVTIKFTAGNATMSGTTYISLPINQPPTPGHFLASPNLGSSLSTPFLLTVNEWQDMDVPVIYQFYYAFSSSSNSLTPLKSRFDSCPNLTTIFPSQLPNGGVVFLWVYVRDYFGAQTIETAQITVSSAALTLPQAVDSYNQLILETHQAGDSFNIIQVVAMIEKEIDQWEGQLTQSVPSPVCPDCAGHGSCGETITRCICHSAWAMLDCSVRKDDAETIMITRENLLHELSDAYLAMQRNTTYVLEDMNTAKEITYQILEASIDNQHFNTNSSLALVQNIIKNTLDAFNSATILTSSEIQYLSEILSDMMSFSAIYDCNKATNFTKDLEIKTHQYLDKISNSSFVYFIPNQNATIIDTQNIDMYFQQLSICTLNKKVISAGPNSPIITMIVNADLSKEDCSDAFNLEYYAFNDNLLDCSKDVSIVNNKTIIAIEITDPHTGKNSTLNVSVIIDFKGDPKKCPHSCTILPDKRCQCQDLSPFDVGKQIIQVFKTSNFEYVKDLSNILQFQFWKTVSFCSLFLFTIWFIATLLIIKYKIPNYDTMVFFEKLDKIKLPTLLLLSIKVSHPLTAIYLIPRNEGLSKTARALVFYTKNLLLLSFSSLFSGPSSDENTYKYDALDFDFNVYMLLLPLLTVQPLIIILKCLAFEPKNASALFQYRKNFFWKCLYFLRYRLNIWLIVMVIVVNFTAILIINSNQTPVQRIAWSVNFLQALLSDAGIQPICYIIGQYILFKIYTNSKFAKKYPKIRKVLPRLFHEYLPEVFAKLQTKPPKKPKIQALKPTLSTKLQFSEKLFLDEESSPGTPSNAESIKLRGSTSPSKFETLKPLSFFSETSLKEEIRDNSPEIPKSSIFLHLDCPKQEEEEGKKISPPKSANAPKILDFVDVNSIKISRPFQLERNPSENQDFPSPTETQTSSMKLLLHSPQEFSRNSFLFSPTRDLGESGILLNSQLPIETEGDFQILNITKGASNDTDGGTIFAESPTNLQFKVGFPSFKRLPKTFSRRSLLRDDDARSTSTIRGGALSPSAQSATKEIETFVLDTPDLQKEPQSAQLKVSVFPKNKRHASFVKRDSRRRIHQPNSIDIDVPKINILKEQEEIKKVEAPIPETLAIHEKSPEKGPLNFTDQIALFNLDE